MIFFDLITDKTPTLPNAKREAVTVPPITETSEQLAENLIWWPCSFCGKRVLIASFIRGREKCTCGAVRCHSQGAEGWQKDGEVFIFS